MTKYLITGTNRGIGLELCRQLIAKGDEVIAVCRQPSEELKALAVTVIENIDVTRPEDLHSLSEQLSGTHIDVLINNAGVWSDESLGEFSVDKMMGTMHCNAFAPLMVSEALLPRLVQGSKIVMITSRMGAIGDNTSGGRYSYRMSKAALNAGAKSLSLDLAERGIAVGIVHPGHVATDMGGEKGIPVEVSAANILQRIDELDTHNSGEFYHANGEILPW